MPGQDRSLLNSGVAGALKRTSDLTRNRALTGSPEPPALDVAALENALLVQELGSFRKVAEALDVKPSVISRRVRALEDQFGVGLFHRQTAGASTTEAGVRILSRAAIILEDIRNLMLIGARNGSAVDGKLCVGIVSSIAGGTARELLQVYLTAHPEVDLHIVEGSPRDHIAKVRALTMDATLVVDSPPAPGCEVKPLWSEAIVVVLPDTHALAARDAIEWREIANERFLVSQADPGPEIHDFVVRNLSALGRHPNVNPRPVRRDALMAMVGLGRGISLVGAAEAAVTYPNVVYRALRGEMLPFSVVWSAGNDNPALRRFLTLARHHVRALSRPPAADLRPSNDAPSRTPGLSP